MSTNKISHITDGTFDEEVLKDDVPVLADFWAQWCGPCRTIAPVLEEIAQEYNGQLKIAKINVDENPETPARFGIQGIPTLILFKDGEPVERLEGAMPKDRLLSHIRPHLSQD
ncbi:MAG: thioredoxin [Candidatus Binatia bacterium]